MYFYEAARKIYTSKRQLLDKIAQISHSKHTYCNYFNLHSNNQFPCQECTVELILLLSTLIEGKVFIQLKGT